MKNVLFKKPTLEINLTMILISFKQVLFLLSTWWIKWTADISSS